MISIHCYIPAEAKIDERFETLLKKYEKEIREIENGER